MKAVILAGGRGTRIREETSVRPKPMVEVGGKPLLWHILKIYSLHGIHDFVICLGYRGYVIKEYFANYFLHTSDVTFHMAENRMEVHDSKSEPWRITLVETGDQTNTGGRIKRVAPYLQDEAEFCLTYGDGVADINLAELIAFHRTQGKLCTMTAVRPTPRWGAARLEGNLVQSFEEKPAGGGWINGGFFVVAREVLGYIGGDATVWERDPLERLCREQQLAAYRHLGFWHAMDTLRDNHHLEQLWESGQAPWRLWA